MNSVDTVAPIELSLGKTVLLRIKAREELSAQRLLVKTGETYQFYCDPDERWIDSFLVSTPDGIPNILASVVGKRVAGVKCFCLCAVIRQSGDNIPLRKEPGAFAIGSQREVTMESSGELAFFANDSPGYYGNNKGVITVQVKRMT